MYSNLDDDLRLEVAKDYKRKLERDYKTRVQITPSDVDSILQQAHMFRNVCAHEERLYDYKIDRAKSRACLLYTSPSPRDYAASRMPSSA
ncbi:hypothetical protein JMUB7515_27930 [Staphylococcus aureus]